MTPGPDPARGRVGTSDRQETLAGPQSQGLEIVSGRCDRVGIEPGPQPALPKKRAPGPQPELFLFSGRRQVTRRGGNSPFATHVICGDVDRSLMPTPTTSSVGVFDQSLLGTDFLESVGERILSCQGAIGRRDLPAARYAEFLPESIGVRLRGSRRDPQPRANLLVGTSCGNESYDLDLSIGEPR